MKKNNILKLLGIAFVVAIASTGLFYGLFVNKLSSNTGSGKALVLAAKHLNPGTVLTAQDLKSIPWPAEQTPKGTFSNPGEVVGKTVFDVIQEGEPVVETHLASLQSGGGAGVPAGMRAVSVHVTDSTGVLELLRVGQKVDVQVVVVRTGVGGETAVRTALEDLTVLSVSPHPEVSSQGSNLPVVTLLAQPAQADVLALADSGARVRLALRNPLDDEMRSTSALSLGAVMHAASATVKAAPRSGAAQEKPATGVTKP